MMIKLRRLLIALVLFCGLSGIIHPSNAQTQNAQPKQKPGTKPAENNQVEQLEIRTVDVRLPITVTEGKSNIFVTDLKEEDFEIYEDKVPQKIIAFAQQSNLPLDVAVLMDTSNSVKPKLKFEKDAAASFIETMLSTRRDRALFATFDSQVELHQDFTNRLDQLSTAVYKVKAQGETRMYDAIYQVCEEKMAASPGRRRAMVIITDGEDTMSERTLKEAIDIAQRTETVIFAISTKAGGLFGVQMGTVDRKEDKDLKRLAEDTGGRAFFTAEVIELEKSLSAIARELRSQYLIAYSPTNENFDGKYRKIEVKLPGKKDLRIRTKAGYNAIPRRTQSARQSP
jgi:Ca-activated chloride channel family protein